MSYTPKTWVDGEVIYHQDLNRIEEGIQTALLNDEAQRVIDGCLYGGVVNPNDLPLQGNDHRYFYLAFQEGSYIHFNNQTVDSNVSLFYWREDISNWGLLSLWLNSRTFNDVISSKADVVSEAVDGDFAGLDSNGNLTDSGKKASDFANVLVVNNIIENLTSEQVEGLEVGDVVSAREFGTLTQEMVNFTVQSKSVESCRLESVSSAQVLEVSYTKENNLWVFEYSRVMTFEDLADIDLGNLSGDGEARFDAKADKVSNATDGNFAGLDLRGNLTDSGKKASDFATAAQGAKADTALQQVTVGTTTTGAAGTDASVTNSGTATNPVLNFTIPRGADGQDGEDGLSAFEIAQQQGYTGTVDQWLASLKANIGEFLFVPTDAAAVTAMATIGQTYSSAIDPQGKNVAPSQNTLSVILLMNDDATTPTKTMMIATQDDGSSGFEFVYAGDLQSAMSSNVLTEDDIVDNLNSTSTTKPLSAKQGKIAGAGWAVATYNNSSIGYIDSNGIILNTSPSGFYNYEFNVKYNEVYLIKTSTLINIGICVFKDANGNTLTDTVVVNTDGTGESNAMVSVPYNATKMVVCNLPSFTAFTVKKTNTNNNNNISSTTSIKNIVPIAVGDSINTAILKLDSKISTGLIDNPTSITESGKEHGYITYSTGNITVPSNPNNSRNLFTYEVNEGQIWFVDMHSLGTVAANVAFYNSATIGADSYMKEYSIQSPGGVDKHYILNIPKGAVRMCLSNGYVTTLYRVRYSEQGAINYYNELHTEIQDLETQTANGEVAYNILECDYLATGEPIQLDLYANLYLTVSRNIAADSQQRNYWNIYACPASNEDRWLRIDQFIGGFSSLSVGGAFLVDNASQIAAGTTIPSSDILITPSTVARYTTKTVNQSVFVPSGKILCLTHSDYITTSYCRLYNTVLGSAVINDMQNDINELQEGIDETIENTIDNKLGVDAIPDAENPLAVIKETAGYTAIFRTMGVIGGSMSSGAHPSNEGTQPLDPSAYAYSSLQFMARLCSAEGFNFSSGGMSAHQWLANTSIGGASDLFNNNPVQMYLIQLGNNDLSFVDPSSEQYDPTYSMGNVSDVAGNNGVFANTFYGKMGGILNKIREVQPRAYVFVSTFLKGYGTVPPSYAPDFDYNQAARNIVEYYTANDGANRLEGDELHYYLIDYYTYGKPYSYYYQGIHTGTTRGSHLVATGYLLWAYQYCTYIDWIIKNNMSDFNDVAFVGSDRYWV